MGYKGGGGVCGGGGSVDMFVVGISGQLDVILQCGSTNLSRCGETKGADQDSPYSAPTV